MSLFSIVVPVYNSEHTLIKLYERLAEVFDHTLGEPFELILIDDNSKDHSYQVMQELRDRDPRVEILQLARNFGQPSATLCGFYYANGDFVITMDDDLQHPPEELPKMITALREREDVDVVLATYMNRHHNWIRRFGTAVSQWATAKMLGVPKDLDMTSFRVMRRFVVDAILQERVYHPRIGNLIVHVCNRIINVPVEHHAREYGHSGYSLRTLAKDLAYDIATHSSFPMIIVRDTGIIGVLFDLILALHFLFQYIREGSSVPGWTSLMLICLFGFSLVQITLGGIGSYLISILNQSKYLPVFVVRKAEVNEEKHVVSS